MPEFKDITQEITKAVRDAAYVVVGLGVLGVQRAQVRRHELVKRLAEPRTQIEGALGEARGEFTKRVKEVDTAVEEVIGRLEATLEPIEGRLPAQARDLVKQARTQAREARQQLRTLLQNVAA
jgi:nitrogen fixation/metabolism regulation signal transduction histidine kinase